MNDDGTTNPAKSPQAIAASAQTPPAVILAYATRGTNASVRQRRTLQKWPLSSAIWCSGIPIVLMTLGALAWLILRNNAVANITAFTMALAVLMLPVSGGFLFKYYLSSLKQLASPTERRQHKKLFRWAAILLFATLPMVIVYAFIASDLNAVYFITVRNASRFPINQMTLTVEDRDIKIPTLAPGATTSFHYHLKAYSSMGFDLKRDGKSVRGECECLNFDSAGDMSDPIVVVGDGSVTVEAASWGTDREHF